MMNTELLGRYVSLCVFVTALSACGGGSDSGEDLSKLVCANFGSQAAAQDAYNKGAKQLDGDGDGRACEALK